MSTATFVRRPPPTPPRDCGRGWRRLGARFAFQPASASGFLSQSSARSIQYISSIFFKSSITFECEERGREKEYRRVCLRVFVCVCACECVPMQPSLCGGRATGRAPTMLASPSCVTRIGTAQRRPLARRHRSEEGLPPLRRSDLAINAVPAESSSSLSVSSSGAAAAALPLDRQGGNSFYLLQRLCGSVLIGCAAAAAWSIVASALTAAVTTGAGCSPLASLSLAATGASSAGERERRDIYAIAARRGGDNRLEGKEKGMKRARVCAAAAAAAVDDRAGAFPTAAAARQNTSMKTSNNTTNQQH